MKALISALLLTVGFSLGGAVFGQGAKPKPNKKFDPTIFKPNKREKIDFSPFKLEDLRNPETDEPYKPDEEVIVEIDGESRNLGTAGELVGILNKEEQSLNALGYTLRPNAGFSDETELYSIDHNTEGLKNQQADNLDLEYEVIKDKIKKAIEDCQTFNMPDLGANPESGEPYGKDDPISLKDGVKIKAGQFLQKINQQQKFLCSVGYDYFNKLEPGADEFIAKAEKAKNEFMTFLGISKFSPIFDMSVIAVVKTYAEILLEIQELLKRKEIPSLEKLDELAKKSGVELPPDLEIPDVPNWPRPQIPKRSSLELKKRKDWPGVSWGERNKFKVESAAWLEVRASETQHQKAAEAYASAYILGNEVNFLFAGGKFYAGHDAVEGHIAMRYLGSKYEKKFEQSTEIRYADDAIYQKDYDFAYSQTFMAGPVPVTVAVGTRGRFAVGASLALSPLVIQGDIIGSSAADAYANAAVGIPAIRIGAEGNVTLLQQALVLQGKGYLTFDKSAGHPQLNLSLDAINRATALAGEIYVFADIPSPCWCMPPWRNNRYKSTIWEHPGHVVDHKIMSYGALVTPYGIKLTGDILDANDREEAKKLNEKLSLEQRKQILAELEIALIDKEKHLFGAIGQDLNSPAAKNAVLNAEKIAFNSGQTDTIKSKYYADLKAWSAGDQVGFVSHE